MKHMLLSAVVAAVLAAAAHAHMVYVVPAKDGQAITVIFSDDLEPDQKVKMTRVAGLKLVARVDGKDSAIECERGDHAFAAKLAKAPTLIHGTAVYGLLSRSEKPTLLIYHPKAILSGATEAAATIGDTATLEVVPITESGKTRFRLLAKGKPIADAEGSVLLPDGTKEKVKTARDGSTSGFAQTGRYAVYFRLTETKAGEHDGKKYEEIRHYATLVVDVAK